jgi:hypothetical protein
VECIFRVLLIAKMTGLLRFLTTTRNLISADPHRNSVQEYSERTDTVTDGKKCTGL